MKHSRRLHGTHWPTANRLGMKPARFTEMEWTMALPCHSTRVKLMGVLVEGPKLFNVGLFTSILSGVLRIGVASATSG
jgi:hypothetical protein